MEKPKPVVVDLGEAVEVVVAGETLQFSEIKFNRKMKGKDMLAQERFDSQLQKAWALYASMSGAPIQLFEELDADQFEDVVKQTAALMGKRGQLSMEQQAIKTGGKLPN